MAKGSLREYQVNVIHKRPGTTQFYSDVVWYAARGRDDLREIVRSQYAQWGFDVIGFQMLNECCAVPCHTKGRNKF